VPRFLDTLNSDEPETAPGAGFQLLTIRVYQNSNKDEALSEYRILSAASMPDFLRFIWKRNIF